MIRRRNVFTGIAGITLGLATLSTGCKDPTKPDFTPVEVEHEEICEASADWLPNTPELAQFLPVPHPAGECPFYRSGWQNFLRAMQPDANGVPAVVGYPTINTVFKHTKPRTVPLSYLGDIKQAGGRQILIDGNGNSLYYGIHVNDAFAKFIADNGLDTQAGLRGYPTDPLKKNLLFPPGVAEFKTAWQIVEGTPDQMAAQMQDYITMQTTVPTLTQDGAPSYTIHEDRTKLRNVTVRLLAVHVVSTLVGHPEFVWASFEHSTGMANNIPDTSATALQRDVAPILDGDTNPSDTDPLNQMVSKPANAMDHVLYKGGVPANAANQPNLESQMRLVGQKFMLASDMTKPAQTSIYRMFPASKSNTIDPDAAITSLNHNVEVLFRDHATDKRGNYRLLGAQWMDKPGYFDTNIPIQNNDSSPMISTTLAPDHKHVAQDGTRQPAITLDQLTADIKDKGSDSEFSILAGEDRMSSTAMESFTQAPGSFNNCFTCHNTQAITANGIPSDRDGATAVKLLDPGLLNVSHILSQFLLEEYEEGSLIP
jgi:hypothetical protein